MGVFETWNDRVKRTLQRSADRRPERGTR
jgi:hypothetical protein